MGRLGAVITVIRSMADKWQIIEIGRAGGRAPGPRVYLPPWRSWRSTVRTSGSALLWAPVGSPWVVAVGVRFDRARVYACSLYRTCS